ncbi:MAG: hypothetical protein PHP45_03565 [Elusimicrobiales bacterium]|nr:hypothetical protein [Elusimicrobiales bacterium]
MQKLFILVALLGAFALAPSPVKAGDATVELSTYSITDPATMAAQISGASKIEKLVVANSSSTPTMVTVYQKCASTMTVSAVLHVEAPAQSNSELDFNNYNTPLGSYTDVCFRKADAVDHVYASAHYR